MPGSCLADHTQNEEQPCKPSRAHPSSLPRPPKDVILKLAGILTVEGGTNAVVEYFGPGAIAISCTGKGTITNMGAEIGATTSIFPYDGSMERYLRGTGRAALADLADARQHLLRADEEVERDPERFFCKVIEIDLSRLEPHLVGPHTPDLARPVSQMAAAVSGESYPDEISVALIGSCTNSSYEDISRVADVVRQAKKRGLVRASVPLMVTPGSDQVRAPDQCARPLRSGSGAPAVDGPASCRWARRPGPGQPLAERGADRVVQGGIDAERAQATGRQDRVTHGRYARSLLRPASTWKQLGLSYFGKGVVPSDPRYVNGTAKRLSVEAADEVYTVDGEILPLKGRAVEVSLGPPVRLALAPDASLGSILRLAVHMRRFIPSRKRPE